MIYPPSLVRLIEALRCLPGVGPKSAQRMAFHLLEKDRNGAGAARRCAAEGSRRRRPLPALPHVRRCRAVPDLLDAVARSVAAVRRRIAGRRRGDRAVGQLSRHVLRADGPPVAARRHRAGPARLRAARSAARRGRASRKRSSRPTRRSKAMRPRTSSPSSRSVTRSSRAASRTACRSAASSNTSTAARSRTRSRAGICCRAKA